MSSKQSIQGVIIANVLHPSAHPPGIEDPYQVFATFWLRRSTFCCFSISWSVLCIPSLSWVFGKPCEVFEKLVIRDIFVMGKLRLRVSVLLRVIPRYRLPLCSSSMVLLTFMLICISEHLLCAKHTISIIGMGWSRMRQTFPHGGLRNYRRYTNRWGNSIGERRMKWQMLLEGEEHILPTQPVP